VRFMSSKESWSVRRGWYFLCNYNLTHLNIAHNYTYYVKKKNTVAYTASRCYALTARYAKITTIVSEQRLGKHVLAETNTHVTIDLLWKRDALYVLRAEII
jgi:hypothetical protein